MSTTVQINDDQMALHEELKVNKLTSQTLADFVKTAFHEKVDSLRGRGVDLSHKTIESLAFDTTKKVSVRHLE